MGRRSTVSDNLLIDLHASGMTNQEIADSVGLSRPRVGERLRSLGLKSHRPRKVDDNLILERALSQVSLITLDKEFGVSRGYCARILRKHGIDTARVTDEDIRVIQTCKDDGWPISEVSATFGWAPQTVRKYYGGSSVLSKSDVGKLSLASRSLSEQVKKQFPNSV